MSFYDLLLAPFIEYGFMRRALAGSVALSLGAAPVGVILMLRRMSLVGDAMAHAILPGAAIGFLLFGLAVVPMALGGLAAGLVVIVAAGIVARSTVIEEDASLAGFYLVSLALGVMIVSVKGSSVDLMHVLFGTVLALDDAALLLLGCATTISLIVLAIILRSLVAECVDPAFIAVVSRSGGPAHIAFLVLVVLNLVAGFQALGTLLAVGMMMLPAAAARMWCRGLGGMMAVATIIALASSVIGLLASYHYALPSGPSMALAAGAIWLASLMLGTVGGGIWKVLPQRHRAA